MGLMDVRNIDYTKKENQTFKNWFWFCVSNWWLQITLVGLTLLVLQIIYLQTYIGWVAEAYQEDTFSGIFVSLSIPFPLAMFAIPAYKGCFQHWDDVCHNRSR
jgi:hypothetical protein